MEQLFAHLWGDYVLQTDWMALNKKKPGWRGFFACLMHVLAYGIPFLFLTRSPLALVVIVATHFAIDRTHVAPWLVWLHNLAGPPAVGDKHATWAECKPNGGYHPSRPAWIAIWLCIIVDNIFHLTINWAALRWL